MKKIYFPENRVYRHYKGGRYRVICCAEVVREYPEKSLILFDVLLSEMNHVSCHVILDCDDGMFKMFANSDVNEHIYKTGSWVVIYASFTTKYIWARPLEMWSETIKFTDGTVGPRFVLDSEF